MADYRELLRKAIDALPENTGANRRAVYEKARGALVSQLRAIEPPLPAREITHHRLNLEDCIREVEQEATDKLLGRHREDLPEEEAAQEQAAPEAVPEEEAAAPTADVPEVSEESQPEAEDAEIVQSEPEAEEIEPVVEDDREAEPADIPDAMDEPPVAVDEDVPSEPEPDEGAVPDVEPASEAVLEDEAVDDAPSAAEEALDDSADVEAVPVSADAASEPVEEAPEPDQDDAQEVAASQEQAPESEPDNVLPIGASHGAASASIEDIIAQASAESETTSQSAADEEPGLGPTPAGPEPELVAVEDDAPRTEKHFIASPYEDGKEGHAALVDVHGKPIGRGTVPIAPLAASGFGEAMSSVREVEIEANARDASDPQSAIDRAIAALDREARGEGEPEPQNQEVPGEERASPVPVGEVRADQEAAAAEDGQKQGGFGALTVFLVIAIVLLAGGGAGGYWAWREGYIDLNAVFAQGDPGATVPAEVAELDGSLEPVADPEAGAQTAEEAPSDTAEPAASEPVNTTDTPESSTTETAGNGEAEPFAETETPTTAGNGPELAFEDRLPAEAETPAADTPAGEASEGLALAADGPQSLLLEEQPNGNAGAVPYSGSVTWSRGTDELGEPTIVAEVSIPARNLDVEILLRRNADETLPASHLMEVSFNVAETFVGGSIANLPGVLLKDEELVQGQPLTGASARIVGNSFLFALSSASEQDVANNEALLRDRAWLDLAMVYGTGRRAILTLEKGEEGDTVFQEVMDAWAEIAAADAGDTAE